MIEIKLEIRIFKGHFIKQGWYLNDEIHRGYDQPAKIYSNNYCEWFINGIFIKDNNGNTKEFEDD